MITTLQIILFIINDVPILLAVVTNSIHAAVIALAATSIGAIYSSTAPDMGAQVDRPPLSHSHPTLTYLLGNSPQIPASPP